MASDLSSVCTEANEIFDDEKEEGEISLEDVSSSEDAPPYRYHPKVFGQCPHCLSVGHCATWCRSLTLNKKIFVRDAGKENRRHHHHHHRHAHHQQQRPAAAAAPTIAAALLSADLQPISSDDDLELVGLAKKKKTRKKKRRKKSPSLSLSPCPVDMAIKDSIHRGGAAARRHQSPVRRKAQEQLRKSPAALPRKPSPQRMKKLKRPVDGDSPLQSRGTVTKLLKKVKKLEPFSTRSKDKRSSLKDKLSNIIGGKRSDEEETTVVVQSKSMDKSQEVEKREVTKTADIKEEQKKPEVPVEQPKKPEVADEEKKIQATKEEEKKVEDDEVAREVILTTKPETSTSESLEAVKPPPPPPAKEEPDEDLQLRVIALRSAVLKKHRTRLARAKKLQQQQQQQQQQQSSDEPVPRIESPFTSSFNEDFPLLAEICSPGSPLDPKKDDIYCPEDMELDSDMELDKEITMVLSGEPAEEEVVVNGDAPYSPTDDLGSPQKDQPMDLSMYTPSKPTETPMATAASVGCRQSNPLNGSIFESRPYSPSDATVYDPELPGMLAAATTTNASVQPLRPPPLPPLGIMPIMPMNLLGTFPIMPMAGFAPVNPMLTAPFIPFTPTTTAAASTVATQLIEEFGETDLDGSPLVPIEPKDANWKFIGEPLYLPELNKLPMAGLVPAPVLKTNKQLQKSPPMKKPCESLFRNAEMRPVAIEEENKSSGATFKPLKLPTPPKKSVTTQPAAAFDASTDETTVVSQKQIWPDLEQDLRELEELEEQENQRRQELEERKKQAEREAEERKKQEQREAEELEKRRKQEQQREAEEKQRRQEKEEAERRKKRLREEADRRRRQTPIRRLRQKSVTPAPRARRRSARTPSRARDIYKHKSSSRSSRDSESRSKSKKTESSKEKSDKLSIDDDEQALREILLASLAKRRPNAKRKAALEAAKRKAALEAAKTTTNTTSDKENIAEKPTDVPEKNETAALEKSAAPPSISPNNIESVIPLPTTLLSVPSVLMPAVLQEATLKRPAPALLPCEQPPRKVVKKLNVITASTRAINNAIRYQNQRKLNQQKLALYKTRFAVNNGQRAESPQVAQSPSEAPRFVISLNEDTESESEGDDKKKESPTKSRPVLAIPTTDFEKSVDQFLKGVRLQQELLGTPTPVAISKPGTPPIVAKTTSSVTSETVAIPDAVTTAAAATTTTAEAIAKVVVTTSTTLVKAVVTTPATIAVPKVATTTAVAASSPKERTVLNIPKPAMTSCLAITATPQAVKHLPAQQQEEYRRLKQQIYEYEQLRLQKTTTHQTQPTTAKPVNTSSSLSTPSCSPMALTTSTPKAAVAKLMPKTQLIAAISHMSKPSSIAPAIVVTPTKIIHSVSSVTTKTIAPTINPASRVASVTVPSSSKPVVSSIAKATQPDAKQLRLLSKITESLNSQKTLLNSAANKISSLKVLTKEQINQKTTRIQQKKNCVVMDDLNKTGENVVAANKSSSKKSVEGEKPTKGLGNKIAVKAGASVREASLAVVKAKDEDKPKETWEDFRQVVNDEVQQTLSNLSAEDQKKLLSETEEKLISKRHAVLDDITEMSGSLRQWEIERDLQNTITAEIINLREQLRLAEERLQGQKIKLQTIQPKVTLYHEKINTGRKECFRLSKICNGLGQQIVGSVYKVPTAGAELLNNRIKEVATHTQKLRGKKTLSVQSNNSVKTDKLLKNNPKVNCNPNSRVKESNKTQKNIVDTETNKSNSIRKSSHALNEKMSETGAVVSSVAKTRNTKNIFNKENSNQPMDVGEVKLSIDTSSVVKIENSIEELQSTNSNFEQDQNSNSVQLDNSVTVSDENQESPSNLESVVTVDNIATMEIDNQCESNTTNVISNNDAGADESDNKTINAVNGAITSNVEETEESNSTKNEVSEASNMEVVEEVENNEIINNNVETPSITNGRSIEDPSVSTTSQIINEVLDVVSAEIKTTYSNDEKLPAVQTGQSADVAENLEETSEKVTETTVQNNLTVESENIADDICTSNSISNNAVEGASDKMETENIIDETRTDEQSTNSGPTIVITDTNNVDSDSVNNSTSGVVNTSLDDYMKEMSVSDEYDSMCSKDCKSSASVTSNEHSTTFEEEIRLLELASETEPPSDINGDCQADDSENIDNCQPIATAEPESVDDCPSQAIEQHGTGDNCQPIAEVEHDPANVSESMACESTDGCETSSVAKTEQRVTDSSSSQSLPKKISKRAFRPYESILKLVRAPRNEKTDGILCPFALMGTCIDADCRYIHQPTSHCQ